MHWMNKNMHIERLRWIEDLSGHFTGAQMKSSSRAYADTFKQSPHIVRSVLWSLTDLHRLITPPITPETNSLTNWFDAIKCNPFDVMYWNATCRQSMIELNEWSVCCLQLSNHTEATSQLLVVLCLGWLVVCQCARGSCIPRYRVSLWTSIFLCCFLLQLSSWVKWLYRRK